MPLLYSPPPSEQVLASFVPGRYIGFPIAKYFAFRFTYLTEEQWIRSIYAGRITVNGSVVEPGRILKEHDYIVANLGIRQEPPANRTLQVLYEDERIRVFNKAAPIPVHPSGRYYKNSMTELLKEVYPEEIPRPVQRLDTATTGVLVFARTKETATFLMKEFSSQNVYKEYHVIVEGLPKETHFTVEAPIGRKIHSKWGVGEGVRSPKPAFTKFEWLASDGDRSLLKAIPRSGRTNQIRVHLQFYGLPVWNDSIYGNGGGNSVSQMGLHAYRLRFQCFDQLRDITAPWPNHFESITNMISSLK